MFKHKLRFRQVHLDFHTSPAIPGVGARFDKSQWQEMLQLGHVDSVTCFSKCHHGWSYHPTKVGKIHPHLDFDLLRAQFDASKEIGVNVPVYISAGVDNVAAVEHPEWREVKLNGSYSGWTQPINQAGFINMCFNSPYLDYLCDQAREAVRLFPDCDGIWSDIILQYECVCQHCLKWMDEHGLDPEKPESHAKCNEAALERYYREFTAACQCDNPNMPVFHNSGHVDKSRRDLLKYFSHLELESLPTGEWGYDHFQIAAKFSQQTDLDFMGMSGKFHTAWGEFGGYKHPNAIRYECAAMMAYGAKCSFGDQLPPSGELDMSTYRLLGTAYAEVEEKEPWCDDVTPVSDVAVLSSEAETKERDPDVGATRALLEEHVLFDLIDRAVDFSPYRMLILPDVIPVDDELKTRLESFVKAGGKLLLTGKSGLKTDGSTFTLDVGADYVGESPYQPDFLDAGPELKCEFVDSPLVMYARSQQVKATSGESLARVWKPYFNRTWRHFCSHQHAPAAEPTEFAGAVRKGNILYLAHPIFTIYYGQGAVAYREIIANAIKLMLGESMITTNMPTTARVTLMDQAAENRYVLHLLYANTVARGADHTFSPEWYVYPGKRMEVIEDLVPLHDVEVSLELPKQVKKVTLEPQGVELPVETVDGRLQITVDRFACHQMVVLDY